MNVFVRRIQDKPKGGVQQTTESVACAQGKLLSGIAQQSSQRYDGDETDDEDSDRAHIAEVNTNTDWHHHQQEIDGRAEKRGLQLAHESESLL